ncbi:MAG: acVLRF1 family peptidyl-tRNA hydrolase [Candidatus Dormibacteria bacterium]
MTTGAGRPASGGGRWVEVSPERLAGWLTGFSERHGGSAWTATPELVVVRAADGARAECHVPFPPLGGSSSPSFGGLVEHAAAERTVGILLARLGGHAAGIFHGPTLVASRVGSRPVHGRSAAGGWSQQRFARRRENQAVAAWAAAADAAALVLLPVRDDLDGLVVGGDRRSVAAVLDDPRLATLRPLVTGSLLDTPDPRRRVLLASHQRFRAVRIRLVEPSDQPSAEG